MQERRLTELETRYTYLERLVEDLSRVLHQQQRALDGALARLKRLETLMAEALDQASVQAPQEKPPHY